MVSISVFSKISPIVKRANQNKSLIATRLGIYIVLAGFLISSMFPSAMVLAQGPDSPKAASYPGALAVEDASSIPAADVDQKVPNPATQNQSFNKPLIENPEKEEKTIPVGEIESERTEHTEVFQNKDGSKTVKQYFAPKHYKKDGKFEKVDVTLREDKNAGDSGNIFGRAFGTVQSWFSEEDTYTVTENAWQARFAPSDFGEGMVRIKQGNEQVGFSPLNANKVTPVITTKDGKQSVTYPNLWSNVDVVYTVHAEEVKESIVFKNKSAATRVQFKLIDAVASKSKEGGYDLQTKLGSKLAIAPANLILQNYGFVTDNTVYKQEASKDIVTISIDKKYLNGLPKDAFPAVVDPPIWVRSNFGSRAGGNYVSFKSDGYVCPAHLCNPYAGTLRDSNGAWRHWRTAFHAPYNEFRDPNVKLVNASFHMTQRTNAGFYTGTYDGRWFDAYHATCLAYHCAGPYGGSAWFGTVGDIDVTVPLANAIAAGDFGAWFMVKGEEGPYDSFKNFDPDHSFLAFNMNYIPPTPSIVVPEAEGRVFVDPQPTFKINPVTDGNGDAVNYEFKVTSGGSGLVISSGLQSSPVWTVPDGVLQDGSTYTLQVYSHDGYNYGNVASRSFKIDMRQGKDSTQTYDTVGPVSIDLATGNVSTSETSHSSSALGGSLGVSLDYNSPVRSRQGLVAQYWNVPANYPGGNPTGTPLVTRVEPNVNYNWAYGSPANTVSADWFYGKWSGYFVAPKAGTYYFGGSNDDAMSVLINDQQIYSNNCYSGVCYGSGVTFTEGQVVKIEVRFLEGTHAAYARLFVKGAVAEQLVPQQWLQTGVRPVAQQKGLTGNYYSYEAAEGYAFKDQPERLFLSKVDPMVSFDWGGGSPIAGARTDYWMTRWTGYFTAPNSGTYYFGTRADDGTRVKISGDTVMENWVPTGVVERWGATPVTLTAGQQVPIDVEYFEVNGGAAMTLLVKGAVAQQTVPADWLSPKAQVLPAGWNMGLDPDGDVGYDRLKVNQNSVVLTDSTGSTHEYTWTGSGYKPPVDDDGYLVRNADGSFTLQDADGRTYNFDKLGQLTLVTNPTDDRKPAALKYTYSGSPAKLQRITDGVNANRYAEMHYSGSSVCTSAYGFDANAPVGMLCAVKTNDGRVTQLSYKNGFLARINAPGDEITDYQYDTLGRIIAVRDATASDAIAVGVRANDDSTLSQITYDTIGRATTVTQPAATTDGYRVQHTIDYKLTTMPFTRYNGGEHYSTTLIPGDQYKFEYTHGLLYIDQVAGTQALYRCRIGTDEFTSSYANCEGFTNLGVIGYSYIAKPADIDTVQIWRCNVNGQHFVSNHANCEGFTVAYSLGFIPTATGSTGQSLQRIVGASEPNGFSRKVEYDNLYRTVRDTDLTGKITSTQYDPYKDMVLSTTDPTGLKSTTIYDADDRPVENYGPAPSAWFGADRKPLAAQVSQVPRVDSKYDEGIVGPSVAWHNTRLNTSGQPYFFGAPKLHTTGLMPANPASMRSDYRATPLPISVDAGNSSWGYSATGKLRLPGGGTYTLRTWHDDSARVWIDDKLVVDNWSYVGETQKHNAVNFTAEAGKVYRFRFDFANRGTTFVQDMWLAGPGIADQSGSGIGVQAWNFLSPGYNLKTSSTVYDTQTGNVTTATNYGANPELGLAQSVTEDVGGLNLTTSNTYEAPAAGYLRQTGKTLPGGGTTTYQHYGADETRDNPCTTETEAHLQAGMPKGKAEADPDGAGSQTSRTSETIYDDAGRAVATRFNSDPWTCTFHDDRGRVVTTRVPAINGRSGRTIANDYAVGGNTLITSTQDSMGVITVETDLLGRVVRYQDAQGNVTTSVYDNYGKLTSRSSPLGQESYVYDAYDRLTAQKLGATTFATVTYDQFSRISSVQYPNGQSLGGITRDNLQRETGVTFSLGDGKTVSDSVVYSTSGDIVSGTENGQAKSYAYDKAGRLTAATIGTNSFTYGFGASNSVCSGLAGNNANAGKSGNRTSQTVNGATTTYCYDQADRLITSSDTKVAGATYDDHGNTATLGTGANKTRFNYDASDRNMGIAQYDDSGNGVASYYDRDVQNRIVARYKNNIQNWNWTDAGEAIYGFTGSGDTPDFVKDSAGNITEKYLTLPGDVLVTIRPDRQSAGVQTYSLPNIHGDVFATTNADGALVSTHTTGPFGEVLASSTTTPWNSTGGTTFSYVGQHQKLTETNFALQYTQMGARIYVASIGRFLQVDPIEGGVDNNYVYPTDPITTYDLTGEFAFVPVAIVLGRAAVHLTIRYGPTFAVRAAGIAKKLNAGRSRVIIEKGNKIVRYDLKGKSHFEKTLKRHVPTPHKQTITKGARGPVKGPVKPMNERDLKKVTNHLLKKKNNIKRR